MAENETYKDESFEEGTGGFGTLLRDVLRCLEDEWKNSGDNDRTDRLELEKRAIMGYPEEAARVKERIRSIIDENGMDENYPPWYKSAEDAVFNELFGLSGIAPWAYDETEEYRNSSSAKLIGDRLYCLIDGRSVLQPQRIGRDRREQLKRALLMATPKERLESGFHEVYLRNGIRVTIFSGDRTKEDQDIMVFRKYVLNDMSFEDLAALGTIPQESTELFKLMVKAGFNVIFAGPVRSGKTTFLRAWQSYEDRNLEGLAIATDPETDWTRIMGDAPVMQIVADGDELENITKPILRGDNDYVLLEEMRDAVAFNIALEITSLGTRRSKATVHTMSAESLPFMMAEKIRHRYGGDTKDIIRKIVENFDLVFEFRQMDSNRSVKKLTAITQYYIDKTTGKPASLKLMKYDFMKKKWIWNSTLSCKIKEILRICPETGKEICRILADLEAASR
jgi:pilus assembly protein CpaF